MCMYIYRSLIFSHAYVSLFHIRIVCALISFIYIHTYVDVYVYLQISYFLSCIRLSLSYTCSMCIDLFHIYTHTYVHAYVNLHISYFSLALSLLVYAYTTSTWLIPTYIFEYAHTSCSACCRLCRDVLQCVRCSVLHSYRCDTTHPYTWRNSFPCIASLIHTYNMTHP